MRIEADEALAQAHPDPARHVHSGYLRTRFMPPETDDAPLEEQNSPLDVTVVLSAVGQQEVTLTIGRSPGNDIVLDDPGVSKEHAVLSCIDRHRRVFRIKDSNSSTNGVFNSTLSYLSP